MTKCPNGHEDWLDKAGNLRSKLLLLSYKSQTRNVYKDELPYKHMKKEKPTIHFDYKAEGYDELQEMFGKAEKIFEEEFGKRCPDYNPLCVQCNFWQDFNNFKRKIFRGL